MRAASRESLAKAQQRLEEVAKGSSRRTQLAADLRAVTNLLISQPVLRRALADPSNPAPAREELLTGLLANRVGDEVVRILRGVAGSRWSSSVELLDAVELLAVEAELIVAEAADQLADVEDELFRFSRMVIANPDLAKILDDYAVPVTHRAKLVRSLLESKVHPSSLRLALSTLAGLGGRPVDVSLMKLVELVANRRNRWVAYVRVATSLTEAQQQQIATRLAEIYGRDVSVLVSVDPSIIGGAVIRVGDDLYDGSIARRLEQARSALAPELK